MGGHLRLAVRWCYECPYLCFWRCCSDRQPSLATDPSATARPRLHAVVRAESCRELRDAMDSACLCERSGEG